MHDIVIRGGLIVDGTGRPGFVGDVAIDGSTITSVGGEAGPARRVIEAEGLVVTPGWVDIHTHYDAQATWDPLLSPSCWHGVTTVLFGNCGVGFAPVRPQDRENLIELMEGVEDIPGITLTEGLKWNWESFPEYLDVLDRMPRVIDIAAQVPHHPLRVFVMGERAIRREPATEADIAEMRRLTIEALRAGAFGFTTSRTEAHKTASGDLVPGRNAEARELLGIGSALGAVGAGTFGMMSDFEDEAAEFAWVTELSQQIRRPVWFLLSDRPYDPGRWRRLLSLVRTARAEGAPVRAEVAGRPVGILMGVDTALNPFSLRPSYQPFKSLSPAERLERLRDPAVRAEILADTASEELLRSTAPMAAALATRWDRIFVMGSPPDYEPPDSASIASMARRQGCTPDELAYDYITQGLDRFLFFASAGYVEDNLNAIQEMLLDEGTVLGLGDAGAHCSSIVDAGLPTFMLTHWARDRQRGPRLPLEAVVKMQTQDTASYFGFNDRGTLATGLKADVNVINYDALAVHTPEIIYDLPAGGRRLIQRADGYVATLVSGIPTFEHGEHTGAMPGRLVRAGR